MAIDVKLRCSECSTTRPVLLNADLKELVCPVCGRRIQNLTQEEHAEIAAAQSRQRVFAIISMVFFALAIVAVFMWVGTSWAYKVEHTASKTALIAPPEPNMGFMVGALVCGLVAMVVGALASSKRYIVEF